MALKLLRLLTVKDNNVESTDFPSYKELEKYASGQRGYISANKPKQKKSLLGNKLRDQVQKKKSSGKEDS